MPKKKIAHILIALSIVYGAVIAVMGALSVDNLGTVAMIGAIALGLFWALWAIMPDKDNQVEDQ